jgi:hypothetical protein
MADVTIKSSSQPDQHHSDLIKVTVVSGVIVIGAAAPIAHHQPVSEDCRPRIELCSPPDPTYLPDGREKHPRNQPTGTVVVTAATSSTGTLTSTSATVIAPKK